MMNRSARVLSALLALATASLAAAGTLTFNVPGATVGSTVQAEAEDLAPNSTYDLVWYSGDAQWVAADGKFGGITAPETRRTLQQVRSDAAGRAVFTWTVPEDYGYVHNVKLERGSEEAARQGLTVVPELSLSPTSGPAGTPITVKLTGVGYRFWESVWHLLYEGKHTGWLSAITTKGTATAVIPATGTGLNVLQVLSGTHPVPYLNQQQAPIYMPLVPTVLSQTFTVTPGAAVPSPPAAGQGLARTSRPAPASGSTPHLWTDHLDGPVGSQVVIRGEGFAANQPVALSWSSVTGNRISGQGWETQQRPLPSVTSDAQGRFELPWLTPDDLGGAHDISADTPASRVSVQYTITPSVAEVAPRVVAPGGDITVTMKGVGWTETANIYTLLLDNSFLGYGCAFNSRGDVTIHLKAPGQPGVHYVNLFPAIYAGTLAGPGLAAGATPNATYFQLPMLNFRDHPGERLPAFQLSFTVQAP